MQKADSTNNSARKMMATKPHVKPGRKRMGTDVFVPVTMKVEPSELATIEMIAKASRRSRSDVMRRALDEGLTSAGYPAVCSVKQK